MRPVPDQWSYLHISTREEAEWPSESQTSVDENMERADGFGAAEGGSTIYAITQRL
jgi:hypothetical protein